MPMLIQKYNDKEIGRWPLGDQPVVLGRSVDADLFIEDPSVSRQHCRFSRQGPFYTVTDLGSSNGTLVNGKKVNSVNLKHGDMVTVGKYVLVFVEEGSAINITAAPARKQEWQMLVESAGSSRTVPFRKADYLIGRNEMCDVVLAGKDAAGCHVLIARIPEGLRVINVSDGKPLQLNGQPAPKKSTVTAETTLTIGSHTVTLKPV